MTPYLSHLPWTFRPFPGTIPAKPRKSQVEPSTFWKARQTFLKERMGRGMANQSRRQIPGLVMLLVGLGLGWGMATFRPTPIRALNSDRFGDYTLVSAPVAIQYNHETKTQSTLDAIYFLDYKGGRLISSVPTHRATATSSKLIDQFIERDLITDFKIDLDRGSNPHFLMTSGALGAYGEGWSPLYVFETTTKQVAVYRLTSAAVGSKSNKIDLLEVRNYAALPPLPGLKAN